MTFTDEKLSKNELLSPFYRSINVKAKPHAAMLLAHDLTFPILEYLSCLSSDFHLSSDFQRMSVEYF